MTTGLFTHPSGLAHVTPPGHPECVERLKVVLDRLRGDDFAALSWFEAARAGEETIALVHTPAHIEALKAIAPAEGFARIDADTAMSPGSLDAAYFAAGAVCDAVDAVMAGNVTNAFCAIRPPGHHATPDQAMGFCLFSNAAIAARHAQTKHGLGRVAVIDFDVHHGNGTEAAFWNSPDLLYASTHQFPHYPGTGGANQRGGFNNILNMPLPGGCTADDVRQAYTREIFPAIEAFGPDFIIISAGFDGHLHDPLSDFPLTDEDFGWLTEEIMALAKKLCSKRLISTLEGGYNLGALASASAHHVKALMQE